MDNQAVETIRLSGEEAISFAHSLFRPTQAEINHNNSILERINENVSITRNLHDFEADISDLDLSFLDESSKEVQMDVETTYEVKATSSVFYSNKEEMMDIATIAVDVDMHYCASADRAYFSFINMAA